MVFSVACNLNTITTMRGTAVLLTAVGLALSYPDFGSGK